MGVGELLDQIRSYYVTRLEASAAECASDGSGRVLTEAEVVDASGSPVVDGTLRTPLRIDIVVIRDGQVAKSLRIETDRMLKFDPVHFEWEKALRVSVEPFEWQNCRVSMGPIPRTFEPLVRWFCRWFEPRHPDASGLLGVTHSISDPEERDGRSEVVVDFGSAPVEAVEQLLDACIALGVTQVTFGGEWHPRSPTSTGRPPALCAS